MLDQLGEDALVARLVEIAGGGELLVGPGDDCAVVDRGGKGPLQLLKTDAIVERVHFEPGAPAGAIGWKAVARVFSDIAAMGGERCWGLGSGLLREGYRHGRELSEGRQKWGA